MVIFTVDTIVNHVGKVLSLGDYTHCECIEEAHKLRTVALVLVKKCQFHPFLKVFAHSASCTDPSCTTWCRMFRYIRTHIQNNTQLMEHECALIHLYGQLMRMHVDTCVDDVCGINSCKDIKKMRDDKGLKTLPQNFNQKEMTLNNQLPLAQSLIQSMASLSL